MLPDARDELAALDHWIARLSARRTRVLQSLDGMPPQRIRVPQNPTPDSWAAVAPLLVSFLGPDGSFSHAAAQRQFGPCARLLPAASISDAFAKLATGDADFAVLPLVNSVAGPVADTLDNLANNGPHQIVGDLHARVVQCLLATDDMNLAQIERVYSHPHAFAQCRRWLAKHLPHATLHATDSTSAGAQMALQRPNGAAVASRQAARLYHLSVLAAEIQDEPHNSTRFAIIGEIKPPPSGDDRTTFVMALETGGPLPPEATSLPHVRPLCVREGQSPGTALHFFDVPGHDSDPQVQSLLETCRRRSLWLRVLGSYRAGVVVGDTAP